MKNDIQNKKDIENLVNTFYERVKKDTTISHFFTDVVKVNWEKHLPTMYKFWEDIVFNTHNFEGNPMKKHLDINALTHISPDHFKQWTLLFNATVDNLFEGEKAELIKQRALSIATVMQIKIHS